MLSNEVFSINNNQESKSKKRLKLILLISIPIILIVIVVILVVVLIKKKSEDNPQSQFPETGIIYNFSTFFFFDPVSSSPCNEKNYWTPFDNMTTCFRWISITINDSNSSSIKLMLDHNIAKSNFLEYKNVLKNKTSDWSRYKDTIDIIDEDSIFNLMQYDNKPDKTNKVIPSVIVNPFSSQSYYIYEGKAINDKGYWTKTPYDEETAYAIDYNGNNEVISKESIYGLRPVINIKKNLLSIDSGITNITGIIEKCNYIHYDVEDKLYDGYKYEVLQGFTVSDDKLFFMSSNNNNPEKGVLYSYKLNDLNNLYKFDYSNTGHGNGMTYNSKNGKVLTLGYYGVCEYNEDTLTRENDYNRPNYPGYSAIGYDYNMDLYIGRANHRIFFADNIK